MLKFCRNQKNNFKKIGVCSQTVDKIGALFFSRRIFSRSCKGWFWVKSSCDQLSSFFRRAKLFILHTIFIYEKEIWLFMGALCIRLQKFCSDRSKRASMFLNHVSQKLELSVAFASIQIKSSEKRRSNEMDTLDVIRLPNDNRDKIKLAKTTAQNYAVTLHVTSQFHD